MSVERRLSVVFCDDIRYEMSNKFSHIGIYREDMLLNQFPAVIPKLCAAVSLATSVSQPFEKVRLFAKLNDEQVFEAELPVQAAMKAATELPPSAANGDRWMVINADLVMSPLAFEKESVLQVFAETEVEGELLKSRKFHIKKQPADTAASVPLVDIDVVPTPRKRAAPVAG